MEGSGRAEARAAASRPIMRATSRALPAGDAREHGAAAAAGSTCSAPASRGGVRRARKRAVTNCAPRARRREAVRRGGAAERRSDDAAARGSAAREGEAARVAVATTRGLTSARARAARLFTRVLSSARIGDGADQSDGSPAVLAHPRGRGVGGGVRRTARSPALRLAELGGGDLVAAASCATLARRDGAHDRTARARRRRWFRRSRGRPEARHIRPPQEDEGLPGREDRRELRRGQRRSIRALPAVCELPGATLVVSGDGRATRRAAAIQTIVPDGGGERRGARVGRPRRPRARRRRRRRRSSASARAAASGGNDDRADGVAQPGRARRGLRHQVQRAERRAALESLTDAVYERTGAIKTSSSSARACRRSTCSRWAATSMPRRAAPVLRGRGGAPAEDYAC